VDEESKPDADDERPPICPACGGEESERPSELLREIASRLESLVRTQYS
jgi:hypothetical protein